VTPVQFEVLRTLFTSGFKPQIWGSAKTGWRIGPIYGVSAQTKRSLERQGWIKSEGGRYEDGVLHNKLSVTDAGRRAFIAAGGNPGTVERRKPKRRGRG